MRVVVALVGLAALAACGGQPAEEAAPAEVAPAIASEPVSWPPTTDVPEPWLKPTEAFHIVDNLYYVGSEGLAAYLFTTDDGHVLLDGGLPENAAHIEANIAALGFSLSDVKILLNSHAHFDHSGGLAELKRKSGAELWAHEGDVSALEAGVYLGSEDVERWKTPPVKVDKVLQDGAVVDLGGMNLTLHHTPGHSRGCSSWGYTASAGGETYEALVFCSATVAANRITAPLQYDGIIEDYRATFEKAKTLKADIPLAPHPEFFELLEKREAAKADPAVNPFIDPAAFPALIARLQGEFETTLEERSAGQ
jgi:metallo-beta-lactamase class B